MTKQGREAPLEGDGLTSAKAALEILNLDEAQTERILRQFVRTQRLAALASDRVRIDRTRSAVDRLASSSMSLEMAAIDPQIADEMAKTTARLLQLERTVAITDLLLAIEHAGRAMRAELFVSGRPTNLPLLLVIQSFLPVVLELAGEPVRIRWNKSSGKAAEAGNLAMKVLTDLTRLTLPNVTDIAVFNMTKKVASGRKSLNPSGAKDQKPALK